MSNLFTKAAVCTDVHLGLKSNSVVHNEDCLNFVKWFIEQAALNECDTAIICGDWHNHRASINVLSLNYSMQCLELLNMAFPQVLFISGNHDLYYRENRTVNSISWAQYLPNVRVINEIVSEGDVTLCPWLVGDESHAVKKINTKYTFGHFELPNYYMNSMVMMPKHGEFDDTWFGGTETVFSGHFHKRQFRGNVIYLGNAFPHNYADAGDDSRGMMVLEWGCKPEFIAWPHQPTYRVYKLSDVLNNTDLLLRPGMHARVHLDITISYEEASYIRETLIPQYGLREMSLIPMKIDTDDLLSGSETLKFESVDQIVTEQIQTIDSKTYDPQVLLSIYNSL